MVFVKSKTENQLIRFVIAYLVTKKQCKMWHSCCYARPQTSVTPDLWLPNSPGLNLLDYRIYRVCSNVYIGNLLKTERWWTEVASNRSVVWHAASIADQAIDQWRVHLNACVKANGKHFENMLYDVLFHSCQ